MKKIFSFFSILTIIFITTAIYIYVRGVHTFESIGQETDITRIQSLQVAVDTHVYGTSLLLAAFISLVFSTYLYIKIKEQK